VAVKEDPAVNSLKTMTLVAVMAAVGYGVYTSLHKRPPAAPPVALPENWQAGPQVQLPTAGTTTPPVSLMPGTAAAPPSVETPQAAPAVAQPAPPLPAAPPPVAQATYGAPANPATSAPVPGEEGVAVAADQAGAPVSPAPASAEDIHTQFARAFDAAQVQADLGKLPEAQLELSQWYDHPGLSEGESRQLIEMLDRLAGTVIYSHKHHLLERPYEVKPGETLEQIAQQHQVPWQLLAKINGIDDPATVQPGRTLKVVRGPFDAVVDAKHLRLTLFLAGRYAGRFAIGVGRDMPPLATDDFEVRAVVANPVFHGQDMVVKAGDPNNPLGRIWIDLGNQVGIHGTNDPQHVGANTGRGCILLKPADISHVQDILTVGSRVIIRR
jgi:lipoprotein-anchoring transpeptidase ErfK/SrfK